MKTRLLILGSAGCPIIPLGNYMSQFHEVDFYTIERESDVKGTNYFEDKVPVVRLDTGDMSAGSASQHMSRDPKSDQKSNEMGSIVPPQGVGEPLDEEEISEIISIPSGIIASEIPDDIFLDWSTHVLVLYADEEEAVQWFKCRRKCPSCGEVYHLEDRPTQVPGICDRCGTDIKRRVDDDPEEVRKQYKVWHREFDPIIDRAKKEKPFLALMVTKFKDMQEICVRVERWCGEALNQINY